MNQAKESERFQSLLENKGLKYTHERKLILEEVLKLRGHFDADEFYALIKKTGLRISRDTVYRTIPLLLECGLIQKSVGDSRREYFERPGPKGHHDHMVCIKCGKVIEFRDEQIEQHQETICRQYRFQLIFHDHRLFGYCGDCH